MRRNVVKVGLGSVCGGIVLLIGEQALHVLSFFDSHAVEEGWLFIIIMLGCAGMLIMAVGAVLPNKQRSAPSEPEEDDPEGYSEPTETALDDEAEPWGKE